MAIKIYDPATKIFLLLASWFLIEKLITSPAASSWAQGLGFLGERGGGRERRESSQRCLTNLNAAPNTPQGSLLAELSKYDQSAPSQKQIFKM